VSSSAIPAKGSGLVVVVTSSPAADAWRQTDRIADPTLTRVGVFTARCAPGKLTIDATTLPTFREQWHRLAGVHGLTRELHTSRGSGVNAAPPLGRDLAATIALPSYSLVVAAGFARVFSGWGFMSDLAALVLLGHGVSFALRRLRVSGWFAIPFLSLFLVWLLAVQKYRDTMTWLIPRGATWDQVELEIGLVRDQFQTAVAPVLYGAGWATLAGFALIVTVVMADSFAFRAEARGEALVPGGVLFVFIAALASDRLRIVLTVLLVAAGIVTVVALRTLHDRTAGSSSARPARRRRSPCRLPLRPRSPSRCSPVSSGRASRARRPNRSTRRGDAAVASPTSSARSSTSDPG
jgi:hypothetical protein